MIGSRALHYLELRYLFREISQRMEVLFGIGRGEDRSAVGNFNDGIREYGNFEFDGLRKGYIWRKEMGGV